MTILLQQDEREVTLFGEGCGGGASASPLTEEGQTGARQYVQLIDAINDGELVLIPNRSGGSFDPLGVRSQDVTRASDWVNLVDAHEGQWLLVTLTIDRAAWLDPVLAYHACGERVREVSRALSPQGIHCAALEMQTKTGEGWAHWHLMVWMGTQVMSVVDATEIVRRAWCCSHPQIDFDTGELLGRNWISCGRVHVSLAKNRQGASRYAAKYLCKPWKAVPTWMGESFSQTRKLRLGVKCFDWLESHGRHTRKRAVRAIPGRSLERRRLTMFERMARSCRSMSVMRKREGVLQYYCSLEVPSSPVGLRVLASAGVNAVRIGGWGSCRWRLSVRDLQQVRWAASEARNEFEAERKEFASDVRCAWERMQAQEEVQECPPATSSA